MELERSWQGLVVRFGVGMLGQTVRCPPPLARCSDRRSVGLTEPRRPADSDSKLVRLLLTCLGYVAADGEGVRSLVGGMNRGDAGAGRGTQAAAPLGSLVDPTADDLGELVRRFEQLNLWCPKETRSRMFRLSGLIGWVVVGLGRSQRQKTGQARSRPVRRGRRKPSTTASRTSTVASAARADPASPERSGRAAPRSHPILAGLVRSRAVGVHRGRPRKLVDAAEVGRLRALGYSWRQVVRELRAGAPTARRA